MKTFSQITILGVGLIGGSIGRAIRRRQLASKVVGIGRNEGRLQKALQLGCVDETTTEWQLGIRNADLVVICSPVESIVEWVEKMVPFCQSGCLLTDAGSTKQKIVETLHQRDILRSRKDVYFVGSHPMAGSERAGCEHSSANLFEDRTTIVTPVSDSDRTATQDIQDFWESLGSIVKTMSPRQHDEQIAMASHLPHVIASLLAAGTDKDVLELTSSGWADSTRIAAGEVDLWRQIIQTNRGHVLQSLENFAKLLEDFHDSLENGKDERWIKLLEQGKHHRDIVGS